MFQKANNVSKATDELHVTVLMLYIVDLVLFYTKTPEKMTANIQVILNTSELDIYVFQFMLCPSEHIEVDNVNF